MSKDCMKQSLDIMLKVCQFGDPLVESGQTSPKSILHKLFNPVKFFTIIIAYSLDRAEPNLQVLKASFLLLCDNFFDRLVSCGIQLLQFSQIARVVLGEEINRFFEVIVLTYKQLFIEFGSAFDWDLEALRIICNELIDCYRFLLGISMKKLQEQSCIPQFQSGLLLQGHFGSCLRGKHSNLINTIYNNNSKAIYSLSIVGLALSQFIILNKTVLKIVIIRMEGLSCESCGGITSQFTILSCDHIVCAECLWGEVRTSLQGVNSIKCSCGTLTTFAKAPTSSAKLTVTTSPRLPSARKLKTQAAISSVRAPSSPERMRESRVSQEVKRSQLHSELQFLGVQFRKSLDDVERNFRRVLESITVKYSNLVKNIRLFWLEEVVESQPLTLLQFPKLLIRKYQKSVGGSLQRINQGLLEQLASMRVETQAGERIGHSCKHHCHNKENKIQNIDQRQRLIQAIEELKEGRGGAIKKIGRKTKPLFQRL